jgi:hypothetical protein
MGPTLNVSAVQPIVITSIIAKRFTFILELNEKMDAKGMMTEKSRSTKLVMSTSQNETLGSSPLWQV